MSVTRELFSEEYELLGTIYGLGVAAANEGNTGFLSLKSMYDAIIIIHPLDVNDAFDVDIEQATNTAGTGTVKTVSANEFDATISTADTKPTVIEVPADALDVDGGFNCINVELTTANTAGGGNDYLVEVWGRPAYKPASTTNLDSVIHT